MPRRKMKVEKLMLILAGLLILPCLLLAQEQASNPYKPKLAPHLIPGYTHYMIAISERGKDIVNLQSRGASSSILSTPGSAKRRRSHHDHSSTTMLSPGILGNLELDSATEGMNALVQNDSSVNGLRWF